MKKTKESLPIFRSLFSGNFADAPPQLEPENGRPPKLHGRKGLENLARYREFFTAAEIFSRARKDSTALALAELVKKNEVLSAQMMSLMSKLPSTSPAEDPSLAPSATAPASIPPAPMSPTSQAPQAPPSPATPTPPQSYLKKRRQGLVLQAVDEAFWLREGWPLLEARAASINYSSVYKLSDGSYLSFHVSQLCSIKDTIFHEPLPSAGMLTAYLQSLPGGTSKPLSLLQCLSQDICTWRSSCLGNRKRTMLKKSTPAPPPPLPPPPAPPAAPPS